jgi:hypothetical protein
MSLAALRSSEFCVHRPASDRKLERMAVALRQKPPGRIRVGSSGQNKPTVW